MPKLVINDKSGKKNTSMNFFLDDKVIKFKENKKEIENVDYGEHTIKVRTLYFKSSEQKNKYWKRSYRNWNKTKL